jgi:hypothetical protein
LNGDFALESLSFMKRALWHCVFCKKNLESRALESVLSRRLLLEMSRWIRTLVYFLARLWFSFK